MVRAARSQSEVLLGSPFEFFKQIKLSSHLLEGITGGHDVARRSLAFRPHGTVAGAGRQDVAHSRRQILRALTYLDRRWHALDMVQWSALLESRQRLDMYRKRFGRIVPMDVADFLILDREFPRAIHFCLLKAEESLLAITGGERGRFRTTAEKRLGRLRSELDYTHISEIIDEGLHEFVDKFQIRLNQVGDAIFDTFFALRPVETRVASMQQ